MGDCTPPSTSPTVSARPIRQAVDKIDDKAARERLRIALADITRRQDRILRQPRDSEVMIRPFTASAKARGGFRDRQLYVRAGFDRYVR